MKLKCIKNKEPGWLEGFDYSKELTVGKEYFGQICCSGQSGYKTFVFYGDDNNWHKMELVLFSPLDE